MAKVAYIITLTYWFQISITPITHDFKTFTVRVGCWCLVVDGGGYLHLIKNVYSYLAERFKKNGANETILELIEQKGP